MLGLLLPLVGFGYVLLRPTSIGGSGTPTNGERGEDYSYPRQPLGPDRSTIEREAYRRAVELVKKREGTKKNAAGQHITYLDSLGKLTGGYGHLITWRDPAQYKRVGAVISQSQADAWFAKDIMDAFNKAKQQAAEVGKYTPDMIAALTSANFQLGDFKSVFKNTFRHLRNGNVQSFVAGIMRSAWAQQTPVRVADLVQTVKEEFGVA